MILWTIQSMAAWQVLIASRILHCYDQNIWDENFDAYSWLIDQMEQRIQLRRPQNAFPLWAWYQWNGERRNRPDLRTSGHLPRGDKGVRIEFQMSDHLVLLSDFDLWHYALNYWYLPQSIDDGELFEAKLAEQGLSFYDTKPIPEPEFHNIIVKSWERIFDIEWEEKDLTVPKAQKPIQATFWELRIENVRRIDEFVAR